MPSERQYQRHHTHRMAAWRRPDPQKGRADGDWGGQGPPWAPCHRRGGRREGLPGGLRPGPATGRRGGNCHRKKIALLGVVCCTGSRGPQGSPYRNALFPQLSLRRTKKAGGEEHIVQHPPPGSGTVVGLPTQAAAAPCTWPRSHQGGSWVLKRRQKQRKTEHPSVQECPGEAFSVQK